MKFAILCGDNLFSFILARYLLDSENLKMVLISNKNTGSLKRFYSIYKQTSIQYFIYRSLIQALSYVYSSCSIAKHAEKRKIRVQRVSNAKELDDLNLSFNLYIAINLDIILSERFISKSHYGVLNTHASDLPKDKGISPVVWAYSRGDEIIKITYYYMDGRLDSGHLVIKESFNLNNSWSLFRTYCEVLNHASLTLCNIVSNAEVSQDKYKVIDDLGEATYNSWPDNNLNKKLRFNRRSYFKFDDISYIKKFLNENK